MPETRETDEKITEILIETTRDCTIQSFYRVSMYYLGKEDSGCSTLFRTRDRAEYEKAPAWESILDEPSLRFIGNRIEPLKMDSNRDKSID